MKLPVAGAFHTALMQPASDEFNGVLDKAEIKPAKVAIYANVSAGPVQTPDQIRDALKRQITNSVLWEQTVKNLVAAGHKKFLELGPGSTVSNMIKRIAPEAETRAVTNWGEVAGF
jgi:[acyl-carrier-protein] S-malonyltransferase